MLKLMREASHSYPWLLKSIMGVIALAFVITMGWWGFGETDPAPSSPQSEISPCPAMSSDAPMRIPIASIRTKSLENSKTKRSSN